MTFSEKDNFVVCKICKTKSNINDVACLHIKSDYKSVENRKTVTKKIDFLSFRLNIPLVELVQGKIV